MELQNLKNKRIFYHGFYHEKTDIIFKLYEKYNWKPVVINTHKNDLEKFSDFKDTLLIDNFSIRKGNFPKLNSNNFFLDQEKFNLLSKKIFNYFGTYSDSDGRNFSFDERKHYFYVAFNFWYSILIQQKPDYFISFRNPHTTTCYLIYLICRYLLNIKILFFDAAPLLNTNKHLIFSSYEKKFNSYFANFYKHHSDFKPSSEIISYLDNIKNDNTPKHIVDDDVLIHQKVPFKFKKFLKYFFSQFIGKERGFYEIDFKINKKPFFDPFSKPSKIQYYLLLNKIKKQNRALKEYYYSKITKPNLKSKFIYFASSYQPEARTNTMCGLFEDQVIALKMLRKSLPKNFKIYFKENKSIFFESDVSKGSIRRSKNYYDELLKIENLELIDSNYSTFELIKNCVAVSTLAGTAGWEAVIKEKPSIVFGFSWYTLCKSIFNIETIADCENAIKLILNGYKPDYKEIIKYCNAIEHCSYDVNIRNLQKTSIGPDKFKKEVNNIAEAIFIEVSRSI